MKVKYIICLILENYWNKIGLNLRLIKNKNLDNIVQALRNGRLSIFAGAGLSASSGYVNWKQLIKPMSDYLGLNINTDLTMIAQYYENECTREGLNRLYLMSFQKFQPK